MTGPRAVVVVPAHDEAELLGRCLRSVVAATQHVAVATRIIVVLDDCRDDSARIAAEFDVDVVTVHARSVGAARRAGVAHAVPVGAGAAALSSLWLTHTDADSEVPANWLACHLALMAAGADVVLGTVRPDFADLDPAHAAYWEHTHRDGSAIGNVHGANLGLRASIYRRVGGFPPVAEHEDALLVQAARDAGARVVATGACEVLTSGRHVGRTPGGYAAYVRTVASTLAVESVA